MGLYIALPTFSLLNHERHTKKENEIVRIKTSDTTEKHVILLI